MPQFLILNFVFSLVLLWHREYDRAFAEVRRCLALAPSSAEGHLNLASMQYYCGDSSGSIDMLNAYMRLDPFYPELALHFLAQAQHSLGQFDAAVATLKLRLERNPNSETSNALLASCYGHLGRIADARAAWAEVMRIAPNFSIERQRRILPYKNPDDFERRVEGGLAVTRAEMRELIHVNGREAQRRVLPPRSSHFFSKMLLERRARIQAGDGIEPGCFRKLLRHSLCIERPFRGLFP